MGLPVDWRTFIFIAYKITCDNKNHCSDCKISKKPLKHMMKYNYEDRNNRHLEVFPAPSINSVRLLFSDHLTAICPFTEKPFIYRVLIEYTPQKVCLEVIFLKHYLQSFFDDRISIETLTEKIADDLIEAVHPGEIKVELTRKIRGDIDIELSVIAHRAFNSANQQIPL